MNIRCRSVPLHLSLSVPRSGVRYDEAWLAKLLQLPPNGSLEKTGRYLLTLLIATNVYSPDNTKANLITEEGFKYRGLTVIDADYSYYHNPLSKAKTLFKTLTRALFDASPTGNNTYPSRFQFNEQSFQNHLKGSLTLAQHLYWKYMYTMRVRHPLPTLYHAYKQLPQFEALTPQCSVEDYLVSGHARLLQERAKPSFIGTTPNGMEYLAAAHEMGLQNSIPVVLVNQLADVENAVDNFLYTSSIIDLKDAEILRSGYPELDLSLKYTQWESQVFTPSATAIYREVLSYPSRVREYLKSEYNEIAFGKYKWS